MTFIPPLFFYPAAGEECGLGLPLPHESFWALSWNVVSESGRAFWPALAAVTRTERFVGQEGQG